VPQQPVTGSFRRDAHAALAANPVGLVPLAWPRPLDLAEVRRLGYEGIQVDGGNPSNWPPALNAEALRPAEVYLALVGDENGPTPAAAAAADERVAYAEACRAEVLVVASDGHQARDAVAGRAGLGPALTATGWQRLVEVVGAIERSAGDRGLPVAFHPHAGTWVETPNEIDRLLSAAPTLSLCLDTGHHLVGGGDPGATIAGFADRLTHVHLKDVDLGVLERLRVGEAGGFGGAVEARLFAPLGSGLLDLGGVIRALASARYRGWLMVEQDTTWEPPVEAAAISRRVLEWTCRQAARAAASSITADHEKSGAPPGVPVNGL